ncbi:ribosomal protein S18-alanine N-acetyltransferase [Piscinibacter sp.]|jgi:ribosomal-protein-alanine N-acetyltransferase|uniref:ribosomal protein S18-alanine N-acetyltransferase n=1 Tax=Piscinibacter sp. TaxID=1903157 RepID=UPI002F3F41E9
MNAAVMRDEPRPMLVPMALSDVDAVVAVEVAAYAFPWTRGNFIDSLAAGYVARVLEGPAGRVAGYFIAMEGVDEMHLLNLTVAPSEQGHGHARRLLDALVALCRERSAQQLWLEVRESNERARSLYRRYGFKHIGMRPGYYPAGQGRREDAVVMSLDVTEAGDVE